MKALNFQYIYFIIFVILAATTLILVACIVLYQYLLLMFLGLVYQLLSKVAASFL